MSVFGYVKVEVPVRFFKFKIKFLAWRYRFVCHQSEGKMETMNGWNLLEEFKDREEPRT